MLFNIYDADQSGALTYKEFSDGVFGRPSTAQSSGSAQYGTTVSQRGGGASGSDIRDPESLAEALK
jgi:hypothetical protein